ncbi:hypothetical protein C8J57DRAFT_1475939 [Mycena rebaudengoi]|nr:hypothetical protein C8J57DRAFT_1475939 [Mycena rebaudengoi]
MPRTLTMRHEYLAGSRRAQGRGWWGNRWDLYFYTFPSSPVSSASTSPSSTTSESCSASEESTLEEEEESEEGKGEEGEFDAPAYTEHTPDFATRHTPDFATRRTPAADFAVPLLAHVGRVGTRGMRRWHMYLGPPRPRRACHAPTRRPQLRHAAQQRRHARLDRGAGATDAQAARRPSSLPTPRRTRTGRSSRPSNCNLSTDAQEEGAEVLGGGVTDGGVSGWGAAAAMDAPDAAHDAPGAAIPAIAACSGAPAAPTAYAATHATPAPPARRLTCVQDDAVDAPAPRVHGGRVRAVDAATAAALCGFGAVEYGGGGGGSVARPAGPIACAARPRTTHAHAHALSARPACAGADAAPRRVFERRPAGGEWVCVCVLSVRDYQWAGYSAVLRSTYGLPRRSHRSTRPPVPPTPTCID